MVSPVTQIPVQWLVRLVQKLVVSADCRIASVFCGPCFDLFVHRKVGLVHLVVRLVTHRADQHPPKGVQVEPRKDVGVLDSKVHHGTCLRCTPGVMPSAALLRLGLPLVGKVTVEVVQVVRQKVRVGDAMAVKVDNMPLWVQLVKRAFIFRLAWHHDRGHEGNTCVIAEFSQLSLRVLFAHVGHAAIAVNVRGFPPGVALIDSIIDGT